MKPYLKTVLYVILTSCAPFVFQDVLHAADPVIHVQWYGGGTPTEDTDYRIRTVSPASPEFPDVELITGHLDWRIWSTDADNAAPEYPAGVGDIGVISCPHPILFGTAIAGVIVRHPTRARA